MSDARKKMLERVRAMLNTEGRTEAEMMAFLAKARELMATYDIDESELKEAAEKAEIYRTAPSDPYEIKKGLCVNVGRFTCTKAFRDADKVTVCFAGKQSDIIFATWLLDTLQRFVMRALRQHQKELIGKGKFHSNNLTSASFVAGCAARINEKLKELAPIDWAKTQELIVAELGLALTKGRKSSRNVSEKDAAAGYETGKHARFDKPVGSGGQLRIGK